MVHVGWQPHSLSRKLRSSPVPQDRDLLAEQGRIDGRRAGGINTVWAARKDDTVRLPRQDLLDGRRVREELAVHAALADPAGDQLTVLGAKIENEDGLRGGG